MLIAFFILFLSAPCGNSTDKIEKLTQDQYESLKDDKVFLDLLSQEMEKEQNKVIRNKMVLKNTEKELDTIVKHGLVEKEFCIRQEISSLRTIDYVYNRMLEQAADVKYSEVKLNVIQVLDRMRHLNKMFADRTLKMEECKLKLSANSNNMKNEIISDRYNTKIDVTKNELEIPYDYPAARNPFR
jgi:hypothetical protein